MKAEKLLTLVFYLFFVGLKGFSVAHGSSSIGLKNPVPMLCINSGIIGHGKYLITNKSRTILGAIHLAALLMSRTGSIWGVGAASVDVERFQSSLLVSSRYKETGVYRISKVESKGCTLLWSWLFQDECHETIIPQYINVTWYMFWAI